MRWKAIVATRAEKVRILEIADRVNEDVATSIDPEPSNVSEPDEATKALTALVRSWVIGTVLLGSGAESIKGNDRQELAALIIEGADAILHSWTDAFAKFDYKGIQKKILADAQFKS